MICTKEVGVEAIMNGKKSVPLSSVSLPSTPRDQMTDIASVITSSICEEFTPNNQSSRHEMTSFSFEIWNPSIAFETRHDTIPPQYILFERAESVSWSRICNAFDRVIAIHATQHPTPCCRVRKAQMFVQPIVKHDSTTSKWEPAFENIRLHDLLQYAPHTMQPIAKIADAELYWDEKRCSPQP